MNQQQKGASNANQIKQASNQPRGAAERGGYDWPSNRTITSAIEWFERRGKWVPPARGLDTPPPQNEVDAVRRIGDG